MTDRELQAICDFFECKSIEAVEALREALAALKAELLDEEADALREALAALKAELLDEEADG